MLRRWSNCLGALNIVFFNLHLPAALSICLHRRVLLRRAANQSTLRVSLLLPIDSLPELHRVGGRQRDARIADVRQFLLLLRHRVLTLQILACFPAIHQVDSLFSRQGGRMPSKLHYERLIQNFAAMLDVILGVRIKRLLLLVAFRPLKHPGGVRVTLDGGLLLQGQRLVALLSVLLF